MNKRLNGKVGSGAGTRAHRVRAIARAITRSLAIAVAVVAMPVHAAKLEKDELKFGFIKLTDCAPVLIAKEKGFFEEEGLYVTLEAQANWKVLLDRVVSGELDGSHMLPGQAIAATIGIGTQADIIVPFAMGINTLAVTVSNDVWSQMKKNLKLGADGKPVHPIKADALKLVVDKYKAEGKKFPLGMVFPVSTHNYMLRYWLASGGIVPGYYSKTDNSGQINGDVLISVTPPPQMPATMEAGTILGYSVGEPWNQQAVFKGIGVPVVTADEIWSRTPEKVFGMRKNWAEKHPNTTVAITRALLKAAQWMDESKNRDEAAKIFSKAEFIGADYKVIVGPITGVYQFEKGDVRALPSFNIYYKDNASYPYYSDAIWFLTQMRRWGQLTEQKSDAWYLETAKKVYRPDIFAKAAASLVAEGKLKASDLPNLTSETGIRPATSAFIDGIAYDGAKPNAYIDQLKIGLKGKDIVP